ncbi:MAG: hypothetical protein ABR524_03985 [Thermoanaerobaculia bacterium]
MKKRMAGVPWKMLLTGIGLVAMLGGCGETAVEQTAEQNAPPSAVAEAPAPAPEAADSRIGQLLQAWNNAGVKAEMQMEHRSDIINSMYGTVRHYEVFLNDHLVIVLEFDPENLNSTGERFLEHVEQNGTVRRTGEKAWRNGEFVLVSAAMRIESGEPVQKYDLENHPEREKILEAFASFE